MNVKNYIIVHDTPPEHTYDEILHDDVVESTYAVVYANTGPSDAPIYDPLIEPTLPIPVNDFKHHVSKWHLDNNKEFSEQYKVITISNLLTNLL